VRETEVRGREGDRIERERESKRERGEYFMENKLVY
jgi:hypothetical protein